MQHLSTMTNVTAAVLTRKQGRNFAPEYAPKRFKPPLWCDLTTASDSRLALQTYNAYGTWCWWAGDTDESPFTLVQRDGQSQSLRLITHPQASPCVTGGLFASSPQSVTTHATRPSRSLWWARNTVLPAANVAPTPACSKN